MNEDSVITTIKYVISFVKQFLILANLFLGFIIMTWAIVISVRAYMEMNSIEVPPLPWG